MTKVLDCEECLAIGHNFSFRVPALSKNLLFGEDVAFHSQADLSPSP